MRDQYDIDTVAFLIGRRPEPAAMTAVPQVNGAADGMPLRTEHAKSRPRPRARIDGSDAMPIRSTRLEAQENIPVHLEMGESPLAGRIGRAAVSILPKQSDRQIRWSRAEKKGGHVTDRSVPNKMVAADQYAAFTTTRRFLAKIQGTCVFVAAAAVDAANCGCGTMAVD